MFGSQAAKKGPSSHSVSSHSSRPAGSGRSPSTPIRPRVNQPSGFRGPGGERPTHYYGRRHDYIFFPVAWTDESTGTYYEKGYYDEDGNRYDNVAFEKDGKYENVVCHCKYCEQDTVLNLSAESISGQTLQCPACGAPLEITSELDEYADARQDNTTSSSYPGRSEYTADAVPSGGKKKRRSLLLIVGIVLVVVYIIGSRVNRNSSVPTPDEGAYPGVESDGGGYDTTILTSDIITLAQVDELAYTIDADADAKTLVWDDDAESYYDEDSVCWLWYNTDVDPAVWQYWYEGISSDYGDYGWMEHDDTGWYIEESSGNWIPLPEQYSTDVLWYIEE